MDLKKGQKIIDGILYENNLKIGQIEFDKVQIDTLAYMSLTDKVLGILKGSIDFKADDTIETDYDEPEAENWNNLDEDSMESQPFDEYSDKFDLVDTQKELIQKVEATTIVESAQTQKEADIVQSTKTKDETVENSKENDSK